MTEEPLANFINPRGSGTGTRLLIKVCDKECCVFSWMSYVGAPCLQYNNFFLAPCGDAFDDGLKDGKCGFRTPGDLLQPLQLYSVPDEDLSIYVISFGSVNCSSVCWSCVSIKSLLVLLLLYHSHVYSYHSNSH